MFSKTLSNITSTYNMINIIYKQIKNNFILFYFLIILPYPFTFLPLFGFDNMAITIYMQKVNIMDADRSKDDYLY